jgi:hypothetical protein
MFKLNMALKEVGILAYSVRLKICRTFIHADEEAKEVQMRHRPFVLSSYNTPTTKSTTTTTART